MAAINVEVPNTLTAEADYRWRESDDSYAWFIVVLFGKVEVAAIYYGTGSMNPPSETVISEVVADRLKGLFQ